MAMNGYGTLQGTSKRRKERTEQRSYPAHFREYKVVTLAQQIPKSSRDFRREHKSILAFLRKRSI